MKCPKCGYLGFEQTERCRNCGYDFTLSAPRPEPDLTLRTTEREVQTVDDLDLIDAAAAGRTVAVATPSPAPERADDEAGELPLFVSDAPLITKPSPPRAPLSVRRATPEVPRLRSEPARAPSLQFSDSEAELEMPLDALVSPAVRASAPEWSASRLSAGQAAGIGVRFLAAAIDLALLALVDVAVVYFTVQICGLSANELQLLPLGPLVAFLIVQNGGYLVAFTAGGQTIGKMLTGIRVVAADPGASLDLGRSLLRTLAWSLMAAPAGLGLLTALFSEDRRGLHDRLAGTKVIRAAAA